MNGNASSFEGRYQLPAWFLKHNVKTEAELANTPNGMVFCKSSCDDCKESRNDDEDDEDDMREDAAHAEESTGDPDPGASAQEPLRSMIHYKTFVELRDTILASFVLDQDGRIGRPEDLGVVFRMRGENTDVVEAAWMSEAGVQVAKAMGVSLVTLDFEDLEELACAFYHQDQESPDEKGADDKGTDDKEKVGKETDDKERGDKNADGAGTVKPVPTDTIGVNSGSDGNPKDEGPVEKAWKPDMDSFTTFLDRYFATRSKRKATAPSTRLNQRAVSTILDVFGKPSPSNGDRTSTGPSTGAVIFHLVDCKYLGKEIDRHTKRRVLARLAGAMRSRREQGQAMAMLVSTEDLSLRPDYSVYAKMGATKGSAVVSTIDKIHDLDSREKLRRRVINVRRLCRCLRERAAHLFPRDLIDVRADWSSADRSGGSKAFGERLWSSSEISRVKTQLVGRAWKRRTLGYSDIAAVLRRVGILTPDTTHIPEKKSKNDATDLLHLLDLNEHEESLSDCVVSRDKLEMGWDDVIVDEETKELMQQILSSHKFDFTSGSSFLQRELRVGGALLYGPPGTGKTHLSRAVAKASGSHMLAVDAATLQSKWVGEAEKLVQAAFTLATKLFPCVLFMDEVDSLFYRRSSENKSWERSFLTQFLQQLDGISKDKNAPLVIVATNRPWDLDEAFLRRLPMKLYFGLPNAQSRARILRLFLKEDDLDSDVDIEGLARATEKYSGSDLKSLCAHAALVWRVEETRRGSLLGPVPTASSTASQSPPKLRLSVEHFVKALDRIQPNDAEDLVRNLDKFSRKYNPRASKSDQKPGHPLIRNESTNRHEGFDVRKLISRSAPRENDAISKRTDTESGMQVQAWCQLDLREHLTHRFHLQSASLLSVVQAANDPPSPSNTSHEIIASPDAVSQPTAQETPLPVEHVSSEDHTNRSEALAGDDGVPRIEWEERLDLKEPLSVKRVPYLMAQMIRQVQQYHAALDAGKTLYTSNSIRPIFIVEPYFEAGVIEDEHTLHYEPLPSATSVRLLKLEPVRKWLQDSGRGTHDVDLVTDPILCSLTVQELEDCPVFDALSYTWGDPCTVYSSQDWRPSPDCPASARQAAWSAKSLDIFVDGRPVSVGANLYLALQAIRAKWSQSLRSEADQGVCFSGSIWVDALCINQQDMAEKTAQVLMMSRIYQQAQNVWCWLGGEDSLCRQSLFDLSNIAEVVTDSRGDFKEDFAKSWSGYDLSDPKTYQKFGIPVITEESWVGIYTLINRAWFKRAWIVQEICFARNPVVLVGQLELKLQPLLTVLTFLQWSRWSGHIEHVAGDKIQIPCGADRSDAQTGHGDSATSTTLFQSRESNASDYNWASSVMLHRVALGFETQIKTFDRDQRHRAVNVEMSLQHLFALHRSTEAGDPRDKVYAFLGMAEDNHGPQKLVADYSLPVRTVYIQAMKFLLSSSGSLSALSLREDIRKPLYEFTVEGTKETVSLPTWVPDFNAQHFADTMDRHMASKGLGPAQIDFVGANLIVSGLKVGSITNRIEYHGAKLLELAKFLEALPPQTEIYSGGFHGVANGASEAADGDLSLPLQSPVVQSRFEVLWRTLCHDTYESTYPAPSHCGEVFTEFLRHSIACSEGICVGILFGVLDEMDQAKRLAGTGFSDFTQPHEALDFVAKAYTGFLMLTNQLEAGADDEITCSPELVAFLENLDSGAVDAGSCITDFLTRGLLAWSSNQGMAMNYEIKTRTSQKVLFTTDSGHLGLGPTPVQEGDQLWILAGANSPSILRPTPGGGKYELVGQAYVHGIMNGEAVRDKSAADTRPIAII